MTLPFDPPVIDSVDTALSRSRLQLYEGSEAHVLEQGPQSKVSKSVLHFDEEDESLTDQLLETRTPFGFASVIWKTCRLLVPLVPPAPLAAAHASHDNVTGSKRG